MKFWLSAVIPLVLLNMACNDSELLQRKSPKQPQVSNPADSKQAKEAEQKSRAQFNEDLKANFSRSLQTYLSDEVLFVMGYNVPQQNTNWSCGKISICLAIAAALFKLGLPVDKKIFSACNKVNGYPLTIDAKILQKFEQLLENLTSKENLDKDKDQYLLRVGALPRNIATYLNLPGKLPTAIRAKLWSGPALDKSELIAKIKESIDKDMPTLFLHWVGEKPEQLTMHYAVVVGYTNDGENILYMDTQSSPPGSQVLADRLRKISTEELLKRMDVSAVKTQLKEFKNKTVAEIYQKMTGKPYTEDLFRDDNPYEAIRKMNRLTGYNGRIPEESDIQGLENFNLVSFE